MQAHIDNQQGTGCLSLTGCQSGNCNRGEKMRELFLDFLADLFELLSIAAFLVAVLVWLV